MFGTSQGSGHLPRLPLFHSTGWEAKRGLVKPSKGGVRIQPRKMVRAAWSEGILGSGPGAAPGSWCGVIAADADRQGQGSYEPDIWVPCKGGAGRVTFRLALPGDLQGPVW